MSNQTSDGLRNYSYSKFQEWEEGIAKYTEFKLAEEAANSSYQPTGDFGRLSEFKGYKQLWEEKYKNQLFVIKHAGRAVQGRTTFYYLGMAKGLLLDRLMPGWKLQYFNEDV